MLSSIVTSGKQTSSGPRKNRPPLAVQNQQTIDPDGLSGLCEYRARQQEDKDASDAFGDWYHSLPMEIEVSWTREVYSRSI